MDFTALLFLVLVKHASGASVWQSLAHGVITNLVDGFANVYAPPATQDAYLGIAKLAHKYGYPLETHTVITEDGYIINMHRIPRGKNGNTNGVPVFLMHGIWESSDSWLLQGPDKSLAYILADEGYDVWMGNARGNRHGLSHNSRSSNSSEFWEFSWEEIGLYDLPTMIDYVLLATGEKSIFYVGYSQGTTSYFVMNSMRPEYNKKIKLMFAMAPEVFLGNARNILLKIFSPAQSFLKYLLWNFNVYSPSTDFFNWITPLFCNILPVRCGNFFFSAVGPHHINETLWPVILGHVPTGCSTLQFIHYGQLSNSRRFCRFDYGIIENIDRYGRTSPPDYNLKAVTSPVVIFHSGNDWFADRRDVELLKKILRDVVASYYVKQFTHVDFMYADDAATTIYTNIINHMKNYV